MKNKFGRFTIFMVLFLLSWLAISPVADAQTPTPPLTRESLIQEIQSRAQRDVNNGKPMETIEGLNLLFGELATQIGMTPSEMLKIYEDEYNTIKAMKPWWEGWLPNLGWVAAFIALLAAIFRGAIEEAGKKFVTTVGTAIYNRVARYRPFWMFALRRYRRSLEATYSELRIPFRSGRPLQMKDIYVPVRVDGGSKQQVDAYQTIQGQKRLIVLGDPGSGKTMLLRHIAFTYARQGLYDFLGQPIPVYLELNRVESAGNSLLDALTKTLENHNFPGAEGFLKSALENKSLLILLDGLDEVNAPSRSEIIKQVEDLSQRYPGNRIIVTCRKAVYQGEVDDWVDQKLEIIEFSDQQIQHFMTSWQKDMPSDKSIEHFIRTLQERPQIMALARNPLLLTMVAYLYTDTEFALPHSRSEFYSRSTDLLLDQWKLDRNRYKATHKRIALQRLALFNQTQSGKAGERRTIELADVLKEVRNLLPDLTLKAEDAQPLLDEIVQRSGLMLAIDGGQRYQFTHLTLQEYFAARALESEPKKILDSYRANPDAWREVIRLWCALEHDSTTMLKNLYTLDSLMSFECLSDAQKVDATYADELIQSFKPRLHEALTNDSIASAFALLAADPRKRGKTWFDFLKQSLEDKQNRLAACAVLARTNIPQAAEPLVKLAAIELEVRPFLVQLGNLAVPALTEPAQKGQIWAMDTLVDIGTPQAALALQPLLWTDEAEAYQSAWRLAALLSMPGVKEELQAQVTLSPEQRKTKQIEWIWDPFSTPDDIAIRGITARVAHLLHTTNENELPQGNLSCDTRLALPLCAIVGSVYLKELDQDYLEKLHERIEERMTSLPLLTTNEQNQFPVDEKKNIIDEFSTYLSKNNTWQHIYSTLTIKKQFDLLLLLALGKISPEVNDWRNLNQPVKYSFLTSWHIKALKLLISLLVIINLGGIGLHISQSVMLFTWANAALIVVGITLLVGTTWIQRQTWDRANLEMWTYFASLGMGIGFGAITGELSHNWIIGILLGILFSTLLSIGCSVVLINVGVSAFSIILKISLGSVLGGALVGYLATTFIGTVGSTLGCTVFGVLCAAITFFAAGGDEHWTSKLDLAIGDTLSSILLGFLLGTMLGFPSLILTFFATNLLYNLIGLPVTAIFWLAWFGVFYLLIFIGKRLERRSQTPLQGLLEPSGAGISPQRSSSLLRKWFWY